MGLIVGAEQLSEVMETKGGLGDRTRDTTFVEYELRVLLLVAKQPGGTFMLCLLEMDALTLEPCTKK